MYVRILSSAPKIGRQVTICEIDVKLSRGGPPGGSNS